MTMHLVKIKLNGDLRMLEIPSPPRFDELAKAVVEAYAIPNDKEGGLIFTYNDSDGDQVRFDTDAEFDVAVRTSPSPLRVMVENRRPNTAGNSAVATLQGAQQAATPPAAAAATSPPIPSTPGYAMALNAESARGGREYVMEDEYGLTMVDLPREAVPASGEEEEAVEKDGDGEEIDAPVAFEAETAAARDPEGSILYQNASRRLAKRFKVHLTPTQLWRVMALFQIQGRKLVLFGLASRQALEAAANPLIPREASSDEEEESEAMTGHRGLKRNKSHLERGLVVDPVQRLLVINGVELPEEEVQPLLEALRVRPRRLVKLGFLPPDTRKDMSDDNRDDRGSRGDPRVRMSGGRRGRGGGGGGTCRGGRSSLSPFNPPPHMFFHHHIGGRPGSYGNYHERSPHGQHSDHRPHGHHRDYGPHGHDYDHRPHGADSSRSPHHPYPHPHPHPHHHMGQASPRQPHVPHMHEEGHQGEGAGWRGHPGGGMGNPHPPMWQGHPGGPHGFSRNFAAPPGMVGGGAFGYSYGGMDVGGGGGWGGSYGGTYGGDDGGGSSACGFKGTDWGIKRKSDKGNTDNIAMGRFANDATKPSVYYGGSYGGTYGGDGGSSNGACGSKSAVCGVKRGFGKGNKDNMAMARFVAHPTGSDVTKVFVGQPFKKSWLVRNDSTTVWPESCSLVPVSQSCQDLSTPPESPIVGDVSPGEEATVSVDLIAPLQQGMFEGYWRVRDSTHRRFGQRLWTKVMVVAPEEDMNAAVEKLSLDDGHTDK